jgi:hypothetical protein
MMVTPNARPLRVTFILPSLTEATDPYWRPIKYSLFPPLGLATLAAYLSPSDEAVIFDEHVETLKVDDSPDLVVIQVYITNAHRSYQIADSYRRRGAFVCLGGLHVTSLPEEATVHADAIFLGPGEQTFPKFLADFRAGKPERVYQSLAGRTLDRVPPLRRDLIRRSRYLVPNSIVVTRGCPQHCDFCYKDAFFQGGRGFYTQRVDAALAEIERLPGRHLYFLDDHLLGDRRFAESLFDGMKGMRRLFQGAATVDSILRGDLIERAAEAGLRSIFVGFETLTPENLKRSNKRQNLGRDYKAVADRLHSLGIMINGSFVFGMDDDGEDVFRRTVDWAIEHGITTATFHNPDALSGDTTARPDAAGRANSDARLGSLRHETCRLPAGSAQARGVEGRIRLGVSRVLPLGIDLARLATSWDAEAPGQTFFLCCGVEEIRSRLGSADSGPAARMGDAVAGRRALTSHQGSGKIHEAKRHETSERWGTHYSFYEVGRRPETCV